MTSSDRPESERLLFFDNVRYVVIICVVVFHAAVGYSGAGEFFMEATSDWGLWAVRQAVVAFIMPLLFFVAGFFALPSLRGRTYASFLSRKVWRLGIPWLLGVLFLGPLMPYLGYYSQSYNGLSSSGYLSFWLSYMASGFQHWKLAAVFTANPQFHHQHFWFLIALLEIFAVFTLAHAVWHRWGQRAGRSDADAAGAGPRGLDAVAEDMTAGSPQRVRGRPDGRLLGWLLFLGVLAWLTNILDLRGGTYAFFFDISPRLITGHGGMFALGLYAYHRGWYRDNPGPGWCAFAVLSVGWIACHLVEPSVRELRLDSLPPRTLSLFWDLFRTIKVGWWLVVLTRLTQRFMNRPSRVNASFAASSYDLYLLQYPVLLAVRLVMLRWDWHAYVKFGVAVVATLVLCYLLSEYLIRRTPKMAVAALLGMHVLLCAVGLPDTASSRLLLDRRDELHTVVPDQHPQRVAQQTLGDRDDVDGVSRATPLAVLARTDSTVLLALRPGGVHLLRADDTSVPLSPEVELRDLAVLPTGLVGIEDETRHLILLDERARVAATVVDSADSAGALRRLAADGAGGVYAVAGATGKADSGRVWHWGPGTGLRAALTTAAFKIPAAVTRQPANGDLLLAADDDEHVWSATVGSDGYLDEPEPIAELFMGDSRYGTTRPQPVRNTARDVAADPSGRLFVATRFGVQVFAATGRLLGVVTFPDVAPSYQPKEPLSVTLNEAADRLLVTCGDEVYAVTVIPGR